MLAHCTALRGHIIGTEPSLRILVSTAVTSQNGPVTAAKRTAQNISGGLISIKCPSKSCQRASKQASSYT